MSMPNMVTNTQTISQHIMCTSMMNKPYI